MIAATATSLLLLGAAQAAPITGQISFDGYVEAYGGGDLAAANGLDVVSGANGSASQGMDGGT